LVPATSAVEYRTAKEVNISLIREKLDSFSLNKAQQNRKGFTIYELKDKNTTDLPLYIMLLLIVLNIVLKVSYFLEDILIAILIMLGLYQYEKI
jgi:hypothetical protein